MIRSFRRVALTIVVAAALLLGSASVALATPWSDVDGALLGSYGLTLDQLGRVSSGYPDGTWHPWLGISRGQFAKMAVAAFGLAPISPATPTFSDVPPTNHFYPYVEGAAAAGLMHGVGGGMFGLTSSVTREQAIAVVARKVAKDQGFDLDGMTAAEISPQLARFVDAASISPSLRAEVAFAVAQGLVKGGAAGNLAPQEPMRRIAAAALLVRAMQPRPAAVLDESDNGTTIAVQVGDILKVVLKGNPTTGYGWYADLSGEDAALLQQVGEPAYVADSDLIGAGGTYTFTFRVLQAGTARLALVYERSWEDVPPLQTFEVTVEAENAPTSVPEVVLDATYDGMSISVVTGDLIEVALKGNPTTGYGWSAKLTTEDAAILEQVGEPAYVADSDLIGAGGTYTFTFRALAAGEAQLHLVYARPWVPEAPAGTFTVTVQVQDAPVAGPALLDGTQWKLVGWSISALDPADFEITANFAEGRIGGRAAVNLYSGPYTAAADGAFSIGLLISTKMAGSGPAMQAESDFFELLGQARAYEVVDHQLTLFDANNNELLIFDEVPEAQAAL